MPIQPVIQRVFGPFFFTEGKVVWKWRWPFTPSSHEVRIKIQLYCLICLHGMHTANTSSLYCFLKGRWNSMPVHNSNTRTLNLTGRIKITADGTRCRSSRVWPSLSDVNSRRGKVVDITNSLQHKNRKCTYCVYFTLSLVGHGITQRVFWFSKIHYGHTILMNTYRSEISSNYTIMSENTK